MLQESEVFISRHLWLRLFVVLGLWQNTYQFRLLLNLLGARCRHISKRVLFPVFLIFKLLDFFLEGELVDFAVQIEGNPVDQRAETSGSGLYLVAFVKLTTIFTDH